MTGNIDFAPTFLELAGLKSPSNMNGRSLLGLLKNPKLGGHDKMSFINAYGPLPTHSLTCLTSQHKYTYWWYGDDQMVPTEELFDIQNDPLELTISANDPESAPVLESMRRRYDQELSKWKLQAVSYNNYQRYGTLFDREISLADKKSLMRPKQKARRK